jgi:hypothetical protein
MVFVVTGGVEVRVEGIGVREGSEGVPSFVGLVDFVPFYTRLEGLFGGEIRDGGISGSRLLAYSIRLRATG